MLRQFTVISSWSLLLVLSTFSTITSVVVSAQDTAGSRASKNIGGGFIPLAARFTSFLDRTGLQSIQGMIAIAAICGMIPIVHWFNRTRSIGDDDQTVLSTAKRFDTQFVVDHTTSKSYATAKHTYLSVRTFSHRHAKSEKLPSNLPLLVFLHGLGGQISQFQFLLDYFCKISHILAIDLPGCGGSQLSPNTWDAYTTSNLAELVETIIEEKLVDGQEYILIGHSMGCSILATLLGNETSRLSSKCLGLIALCPKAGLSEKERKGARFISALPSAIFNTFRYFDRRGGENSASVRRFVSPSSTREACQLQLEFNERSQTPTALRLIRGFSPPPRDAWREIICPILFLAGGSDHVTPPSNVDTIVEFFSDFSKERRERIKRVEISEAGHGVMYEKYHHVCHIMAEFMSKYIKEEMCLSWQLEYLKEGKWILKNEEKWMRTPSVSGRIGNSMFKAMKTLRQDDPIHNPMTFITSNPDISHIVDISFDDPPYLSSSFEGSHITYHKFSTKSKTPPSIDQVGMFIDLIDSIHAREQLLSFESESKSEDLIAVHCHYGFNRTGLFICGYMIERLGYGVQEAIDAFKAARHPGIRHAHFIDELFVRYDGSPGSTILRVPTL